MTMLQVIQWSVPAARADEAVTVLSAETPHGWEEEQVGETVFYRVHLHDGEAARSVARTLEGRIPGAVVSRSEAEDKDWALAWKEFFTPIATGRRFLVLPPWLSDTDTEGRQAIVIEPRTAFGTGHHATTALCLEAVSDLMDAGRLDPAGTFLDLGTGTGILGLACTMLGMTGLGLDIDPLAVENAVANRELNRVPERSMALATGSVDALAPGRTFHLVLANILANPLKAMSIDLASRVAPGGSLVLSGILAEQADAVARAYTNLGLDGPDVRTRGDGDIWSALIYSRPA